MSVTRSGNFNAAATQGLTDTLLAIQTCRTATDKREWLVAFMSASISQALSQEYADGYRYGVALAARMVNRIQRVGYELRWPEESSFKEGG